MKKILINDKYILLKIKNGNYTESTVAKSPNINSNEDKHRADVDTFLCKQILLILFCIKQYLKHLPF